MPSVKTYTTAPEAYDVSGTRTLMRAGFHVRGGATCAVSYEAVRVVETPEEHAACQRQRYEQGLYLAATPEQYEDLKRFGLVVEGVPA